VNLKTRHSTRLFAFDYSSPGAYFLTICARGRECLLGEVVDGEVRLSAIGEMVTAAWLETESVRPNVSLDAFVVMPNHVHAIVVIETAYRGVSQCAVTEPVRHVPAETAISVSASACSPSQTVGAIVRGFKGAVTKRVNEYRGTPGEPLWQRNYYDHVIRTDADLERIRRYIDDTPARWADDEENPAHGL
jgi:REP element-mobilizing transposase RayT